jgi:hypothetical protein
MAKLNTADRKALPTKDFAGPGRSFPINDETHARKALQLDTHKPASEQASIRSKVKAKFPDIDSKKKDTPVGKMVRGALST